MFSFEGFGIPFDEFPKIHGCFRVNEDFPPGHMDSRLRIVVPFLIPTLQPYPGKVSEFVGKIGAILGNSPEPHAEIPNAKIPIPALLHSRHVRGGIRRNRTSDPLDIDWLQRIGVFGERLPKRWGIQGLQKNVFPEYAGSRNGIDVTFVTPLLQTLGREVSLGIDDDGKFRHIRPEPFQYFVDADFFLPISFDNGGEGGNPVRKFASDF
jgi:hypothetical protein